MNRCLPTFTTLRASFLAFVILALVFVPLASAQDAQGAVPVPDVQTIDTTVAAAPAEGSEPVEIISSTITMTAIPPRLGDDGSLRGDPGSTIQAEVRFRNESDQPITFDTFAEDFIIGEDGKTPVTVTETVNSLWSLASWVQISRTRNTVDPFGSVTIPVIIQVPENALPGGRYTQIMHQPVASSGEAVTGETGGKTGISQRVGTMVYFRVNGDIKENATIRNIKIPFLTEFGPVPMAFDIENMSDIHIRPLTTITIKNMLGQTSEVIEVDTKNVFPYTTRSFETEWDRVWGFGRYTAMINASYGEQGKVAQVAVSFWLIPYKLIIAIVLVFVALIGIAVAIRRHLLHRNSVDTQHVTLLEDRIQQLEQELQRRK